MDTIEFMENMLDIKLLDYQKEIIEYIKEHPNCKIIFSRRRSTPSWFLADGYVNQLKMKN